MIWGYVVLTFVSGALLAAQPLINGRVAHYVSHPMIASLFSISCSFVCILAILLALRVPLPTLATVRSVPLPLWSGGVIGAVFVSVALFAAPKLGSAQFIAFMVAGQLVASLLFDHFGLLGVERHGINVWRVLGAGCLVAGVVLIRLF